MSLRRAVAGRASSRGPWPFITLRSAIRHGHRLVWRARDHRKGLSPADRGEEQLATPLWRRRWFNWLIGLFFAAGSVLFALGSALSLLPASLVAASPLAINLILFAGSVPFTVAGYLQHFQSANAGSFTKGDTPGPRIHMIGWRPCSVGWISTLAQFLGTLAFNFNTGDAIHPPPGWLARDVAIWAPGFAGSALFLLSGYLAFIESSHSYWRWAPRDPEWRLVSVNLAGCVFFMISSCLALAPAGPAPAWAGWSSNFWLLLGSLAFLAGATMLMREARRAPA